MESQPQMLAADSDWRDWANLSSDMTHLIAERILSDDVADLIRFRAACSSWRQYSSDPRADGGMDRRFNPRQWIMLVRRSRGTLRHFVNVFTDEHIRVDLHELASYTLSRYRSNGLEGLLVLRDNNTHVIRLFNPLTRQFTDFSPATPIGD